MRELDARILALAVPALGTLAVEPLYVLADTAVVGRLGTIPLGGLALASTVLNTLLWGCNFLATGTTSRVGFLTGRGEDRGAAEVAVQALWLAAILGLAFGAVLAGAARPLAHALGGHGHILYAAATYLRISAAGMPAVLVTFVGHGWLRGRSNTRAALAVVVVANAVNLVLELVLVYGLDLGIAGSAWGTVVAQWLSAAWFLTIVGRGISHTGAGLPIVPREVRRLLVVGRHMFVRTGALLAALTIATGVAARISPAALAGHQIGLQVFVLLALVVDALAVAAQTLVATHLGAGRTGEARASARRALELGLAASLVLAVVVLATATVLPQVFTHDAAVARAATGALVVVAVMQVPGAVAFVLDGVLQGASDFRYLQWAMLGVLALFLPLAAAVVRAPSVGITGLWLALLVWMTARALANADRFRRGTWAAAGSMEEPG